MSEDTPISYRNLVIYEVYVRNHTSEGTFKALEMDLPRIRSMGVDVLWLMPIHPIGQHHKKGTLGCPYSIADYRSINPEYGSLDDFQDLIHAAHALGLKVMIDVVYNHTAYDSILVKEHPSWFHQDVHGVPVTTVPDWSDVIDLKYTNEDLAAYLIETLCSWAVMGVDGFRCDVASLVPIEFWKKARESVNRIKPGMMWLAESVHAGFVAYRRAHHLHTTSDSELYSAFDLTYCYDIWPIFQSVVRGDAPPERYLEMLRFQDAIYPENFNKMRYVENHDQARIMSLALNPSQAKAWTAFEAFNKGSFLIYAGQESGSHHTPSLFDRDPIDWKEYPLQNFLTHLAAIKKKPTMVSGDFVILADQPVVQAAWMDANESLFGVFNVNGVNEEVSVPIPDGSYLDLITKRECLVSKGKLHPPEDALILDYARCTTKKPFFSALLDYNFPVL
jgi:glycosidase